jgi:nitrate reductase NapAB chaperone NapD
MVKTILPRKNTEIHGRKDEGKIIMATESTEEHGKIRSINKSVMSEFRQRRYQ